MTTISLIALLIVWSLMILAHYIVNAVESLRRDARYWKLSLKEKLRLICQTVISSNDVIGIVSYLVGVLLICLMIWKLIQGGVI